MLNNGLCECVECGSLHSPGESNEQVLAERDALLSMTEHCSELRFSCDTDFHGLTIQTDHETGLSRVLNEDTDYMESGWNGVWYDSQAEAYRALQEAK